MRKKYKNYRDYDLSIHVDDWGNIFYCKADFEEYRDGVLRQWKNPIVFQIHKEILSYQKKCNPNRRREKRDRGYWKKLSVNLRNELVPENLDTYANNEIFFLWISDNIRCWRSKIILKAVAAYGVTPSNKRIYRVMKKIGSFN